MYDNDEAVEKDEPQPADEPQADRPAHPAHAVDEDPRDHVGEEVDKD